MTSIWALTFHVLRVTGVLWLWEKLIDEVLVGYSEMRKPGVGCIVMYHFRLTGRLLRIFVQPLVGVAAAIRAWPCPVEWIDLEAGWLS